MSKPNLEKITLDVIKTSTFNTNQSYDLLAQHLDEIKNNEGLLNKLGLMFYQHVEYELAKQTFIFALKIFSKNHSFYNNLGLTLNRLGQGSEAVKQYQKAIKIKPDYHAARSNLAYTLLYFGTTGRNEILTAHKSIDSFVFPTQHNYLNTKKNTLATKTKIRIAYVSADLRNHAVGRFMQGILQAHNTDQFDIHILDNRPQNNDETAKRLKSLHSQWIDISQMSTTESCQLIAKLGIDILIDLSGHTKGGRPDIFSQRSAPIQITYLGYPATTGIKNIDYRISDQYSDPVENDKQLTETALRLRHAMWNYSAWQDMPEEFSQCPFERNNGTITFGSANNHAKIQERWLKTWAKVLAAVPNSKLLIKSRSLKSPVARDQLLLFFQNNHIKRERIQIEHYSPNKSKHWQTLQDIDIALDSFPYNGTTTTCDLLNLGIPTVTRSGNSHVSRTTGSILTTLGLSSWIALNDQQFIDICVEKAKEVNELRKLRHSLRVRFNTSTLGNTKLFLIEYEANLKKVWQLHCSKGL